MKKSIKLALVALIALALIPLTGCIFGVNLRTNVTVKNESGKTIYVELSLDNNCPITTDIIENGKSSTFTFKSKYSSPNHYLYFYVSDDQNNYGPQHSINYTCTPGIENIYETIITVGSNISSPTIENN